MKITTLLLLAVLGMATSCTTTIQKIEDSLTIDYVTFEKPFIIGETKYCQMSNVETNYKKTTILTYEQDININTTDTFEVEYYETGHEIYRIERLQIH